MNVALAIIFGLVVAVMSFPLGVVCVPTVVLYIIGRRWLTMRGRKLGVETIGPASTFGLWFRCIWGWAWRSALIYLLPFGILAMLSGGNDPMLMGHALAKVIVGWMLTGLFSLDAPIWPLREVRQGGGTVPSKEIYDQIAEEFRTNACDQGLLLKSLSLAGGNKDKATALYTAERASILAFEKARSDRRPTTTPVPAVTFAAVLVIIAVAGGLVWAFATVPHLPANKYPPIVTPQEDRLPESKTETTAVQTSNPFGDIPLISPESIPNLPAPPQGFVLDENIEATSMYQTGLNYEKGIGVTQNYASAMQWYQKAAAQYDTRAMVGIARLYRIAPEQPNLAVAMKWYQKAASLGDPQAMTEIGVLYQNGIGVTQDFTQAMNWYKPAADAGNADAMYCIGYNYENGWGVDRNTQAAVAWYQKAAAQGDSDSQRALKRLGINP